MSVYTNMQGFITNDKNEFKTNNQLIKEFKEAKQKQIKEEMLMKRMMYEKSQYDD